jgi:hypothetical protein
MARLFNRDRILDELLRNAKHQKDLKIRDILYRPKQIKPLTIKNKLQLKVAQKTLVVPKLGSFVFQGNSELFTLLKFVFKHLSVYQKRRGIKYETIYKTSKYLDFFEREKFDTSNFIEFKERLVKARHNVNRRLKVDFFVRSKGKVQINEKFNS